MTEFVVGEIAVVYYKDGSSGHVVLSDLPTIDRAITRWSGEGEHRFTDDEQRDSVVRMTAANGSRLVMLASFIVGYSVSTAENRRRRQLIEQALDGENADLKGDAKQPSATAAPQGASA